MLVEHIHTRMDTKLIFHSIHVSIHTLQNNFLSLVIEVMVLLNTKHQVAIFMLKKAIIGILHSLLIVKYFTFLDD
jgi:hypothetical protein